jgi:hypothetical protein
LSSDSDNTVAENSDEDHESDDSDENEEVDDSEENGEVDDNELDEADVVDPTDFYDFELIVTHALATSNQVFVSIFVTLF